jgi:hypothetical protein
MIGYIFFRNTISPVMIAAPASITSKPGVLVGVGDGEGICEGMVVGVPDIPAGTVDVGIAVICVVGTDEAVEVGEVGIVVIWVVVVVVGETVPIRGFWSWFSRLIGMLCVFPTSP